MIVHPDNWQEIGQPISLEKIEDTLLQVLSEIPCKSLALSGGVDSSLLFYYLQKINSCLNVFTMGNSSDHPDIVYSKLVVKSIGRQSIMHKIYIPNKKDIEKASGSSIYKLFYEYVSNYTHGIITGDGVDEFNCGYYPHQKKSTEKVYYDFLRRLNSEHLIPLDQDSGDLDIYLPYIDKALIILWSQIPMNDKVDKKTRKKIIMSLAKDKLPSIILERWKYGFCDALNIKEDRDENKTPTKR